MRSYKATLDQMLDQVFAESDRLDMTLEEMALASGLHFSTVYRINNRETLLPRFKTVMALARAVGMDLELVQSAVRGRKAG